MIAALYDIHGNLPALEAVLDDLRRAHVERVVVGGDVFPGPMASEALERLRTVDLPIEFIRGNGDRLTLELRQDGAAEIPEAYRAAMKWGADRLTREQAAFVADWPATLRVDVNGQRVLFCHATPQNDVDIFTRITPEAKLLPMFASADADVVVCGHTHMQFERTIGGVRVVNAGSVGMPFADPGAYWLVIGAAIELRKTQYDLTRAAERVRACGYPQAEQFAATNILNPPTAEQMTQVFEGRSF